MSDHPATGIRVRLIRAVERFPHFIAPEGARGTITYADEWSVSVRLDDHLPGAEDWDNEVCWYLEDTHFHWARDGKPNDPLIALAYDCAPLLAAARGGTA